MNFLTYEENTTMYDVISHQLKPTTGESIILYQKRSAVQLHSTVLKLSTVNLDLLLVRLLSTYTLSKPVPLSNLQNNNSTLLIHPSPQFHQQSHKHRAYTSFWLIRFVLVSSLQFSLLKGIVASDVSLPFIIIQGGSDKSGIFFFLLLNGTTQLKTIRFCWSKKKLAEIHIENQLIQ